MSLFRNTPRSGEVIGSPELHLRLKKKKKRFPLIRQLKTCFDHNFAKSTNLEILQSVRNSGRRDVEEGSVKTGRYPIGGFGT